MYERCACFAGVTLPPPPPFLLRKVVGHSSWPAVFPGSFWSEISLKEATFLTVGVISTLRCFIERPEQRPLTVQICSAALFTNQYNVKVIKQLTILALVEGVINFLEDSWVFLHPVNSSVLFGLTLLNSTPPLCLDFSDEMARIQFAVWRPLQYQRGELRMDCHTRIFILKSRFLSLI